MSRKDLRRAIALTLPPDVWRAVRAHRRPGSTRRLMDTVRVLVEAGLRHPPEVPALPALPQAPCRALQLPRPARARVATLARDWGMSPAQVVCILIRQALAAENRTQPLSRD
ncbi:MULTISPECIES: hypothetical protein [unclassified Meridianimarinicoccus]|uniref:hypothetical protein n=1 Tax=unclassified Meridianimarinicoccus TaxID=2923344 RepID=UPI001866D0F6|nr:hypothetical protein [Fluviibacterium sp. MJW13]